MKRFEIFLLEIALLGFSNHVDFLLHLHYQHEWIQVVVVLLHLHYQTGFKSNTSSLLTKQHINQYPTTSSWKPTEDKQQFIHTNRKRQYKHKSLSYLWQNKDVGTKPLLGNFLQCGRGGLLERPRDNGEERNLCLHCASVGVEF